MGEILIKTYNVLVLKVRVLATDRATPARMRVEFILQGHVGTELQDLWQLEVNEPLPGLAELLRERGSGPNQAPVDLPATFWAQFNDASQQHVRPDRPLWVHLIEPYGALRFVPWERLLGDRLKVPVLMLPDFIFKRPLEAAAVLDVAVCASAPLGYEEHFVREGLKTTIRAILHGSSRQTRVHVFTDASLVDGVKAEFAAEIGGDKVAVHEPTGALRFVCEEPNSRVSETPGVLRSPWLRWMREALRERAVDVVHFCCHGYLSRGRGVLLFAQSPLDRTENFLSAPVGVVELQAFLTRVGAWSSAFEVLPDKDAAHGLRALADEIAQSRPGPMLMHSQALDPSGEMLAAAYRFIYSATPGEPPRSTALFLYCQPELSSDAVTPDPAPMGMAELISLASAGEEASPAAPTMAYFEPQKMLRSVAGERYNFSRARNDSQWAQANAASQKSSGADELFSQPHNPPPWVAATERMADSVKLRFQEMARNAVLPAALVKEKSEIAGRTLDKLRQAVADLAKQRGTKGGL